MKIKWDGIGAFSCRDNMQSISSPCGTGCGCIQGLGAVLIESPTSWAELGPGLGIPVMVN